jgi:prepilin-type processing-associated H-X9-DG protein
MINWWHATDAPPVFLDSTIEDTAYIPGLWINKDRVLWSGQEHDAINGRHPNKTVNVGYVDGHISRTKADDLFVEKTDDSYKNRSPLWAPKGTPLFGPP